MKGGWSIDKVIHSNGYVDIYIGLKLALLNSTESPFNMNKLNHAVQVTVKKSFEMRYFDSFYEMPKNPTFKLDNFQHLNKRHKIRNIVRTHINLKTRIIPFKLPLVNEHLIEIISYEKIKNNLIVMGYVNEISGSEIVLNSIFVSDMISLKDMKTIPHELGHTLGLLHPDQNRHLFQNLGFKSDQFWSLSEQKKDTLNMMYSGFDKWSVNGGSHITSDQMKQAIFNIQNSLVNN